jgi:amino acid adenylation domain-containing protein
MHLWQPAEQANSLRGSVVFSTDLFDAATIERTVGHFETLLNGIVADPDTRIGQLPLLTAAQRQQLLVEWNDTAVDYRRDRCVQHLFEEQAERTPDAVAVVFEEQQLSYRELNERSNQLAHHLRSLSVGPETRVGLCLERSPKLAIGILGVLKAGGAYVPLDVNYPRQRLAFMLDDAAVEHLVTQESLLDRLPPNHGSVTCMDREAVNLAACCRSNPSVDVVASNLAYVLYTSGSTGMPKGVAMPHAALVNLIDWHRHDPHLGRPARTLQFASCGFDVSFQEMLSTWSCGGTLVLISAAVCRDPRELWNVIVRARVERLFLPYVALQQLAAIADGADAQLRDIVSAGETLQLTPEIRHMVQRAGNCRLYNHYGPTECHVVTSLLLGNDSSSWPSEAPIGRPIANTRLYVLDDRRLPLPIGVPGELYIGGAGLARGYLNRPELTALRFVPHPFSDDPSSRLYRTGDRCRWRADGNLEFLGRLDDQVKLRGFRIELGEIEAVLNEHESVAHGVVVLREDRPGDPRLVAYCVSSGNAALSVADLTRHLSTRLPDYMVPSVFVPLEAFPLTPSGKINRRALPATDDSRAQLESVYAAPRNPIEEHLASIWCDVLDIPSISIHDNFFALGGHSLLATRVAARVSAVLEVELPLRRLFEAPTIAGLAVEINALRSGAAGSPATPLERVERQRIEHLPLSFAQQRLWFLEQMEGELTAYNMPFAWRLRGSLNIEALRRALELIVQRHEPLRTTYALVDGEPVQLIGTVERFELPLEDLSGLAMDHRAAEILNRCVAEAERPFNLVRDLMVRASLMRLAENEHVLLLTMHHIASDGWSLQVVFWRELELLYQACCGDGNAGLPDLPVQYTDYAVWQRKQLEGERLTKLLDYWRKQLEGVSALELPTDRPRPSMATYRGDRHDFTLGPERIGQLQSLSQAEGVSLQMTLLAAFQVFLSRYSGQDDIAVGTPIAGRNHVALEGLIGLFVNTLVLRTDLSGDPTFRELLGRVRQVSLAAYDHQDLPFEKLVEELQPVRHLSRSPLVQVLFQVLRFSDQDLTLRDLEVSRLPGPLGRVRFDLEMHLWQPAERANSLHGSVQYSTDLFDAATIERMVGHFLSLLEGIVADPDTRIGLLPLLTEAERRQLLVEWNDTRRDYPRDKCVHELFEEQAQRTPEALAAICGDRQLTYRELNDRANQLAHELASLSVGRGDLVGVFLERSLDLITVLVGILKAGGAYLPLDPATPPQRLALLLADARVSLVVSQTSLRDRLPPLEMRLLCLEDVGRVFASHGPAERRPAAGPEDLAYVMFTSGSTGVPKGVEVPHRAINRLLFGVDYARFDASIRIMQLAPISFDASTLEVWGPLLHGGCCVLFPGCVPDFAALERELTRHRVRMLWLTASLFNAVMDERPQALRGIEQLLIGGEALSVPRVRRALSLLGPSTRLINAYGPTECTTFACCYPIPQSLSASAASVPIGRPIANTQAYVLDRNGELVPIGVPGELYLGGDGLARGYLNRPELTSQRFVSNPFQAHARLYRTGDQVRWRPDGTLEFLGRFDDQVKLRGFRIELAEIEAVMAGHPDVSRCVAATREDSPGEKRLVAYWVPRPDANATPGNLREFLRARLPDHMIPASFVRLDALPMTVHGKIDRRRLPDPTRPNLGTGHVAPRSALEEQLARIWAKVLGLERVGIHDNFFELGGHSLLAMRLLAAVEQAFLVPLPLISLFRHPTIAQLEGLIREPRAELTRPAVQLLRAGHPDQPPLVVAPSLFGHVDEWRKVVELLPTERAIYGLVVAGSEPYWPGCETLQDVAQSFVAALMDLGWTQPCHLVGYSFGGILAFEVARQLAAAGGRVGTVVVVDTGLQSKDGNLGTWLVQDLPSMVRNFPQWFWMSVMQRPREFLDRMQLKVRSRLARLVRFAEGKGNGAPPGDARLAGVFDLDQMPPLYRERLSISWRLVHQYRPGQYHGQFTLLRCQTRKLVHHGKPDSGWGDWVDGPLEIRDLPGNHGTVFIEPYIDVLIDQIHQIILNGDEAIRIQASRDLAQALSPRGVE